MILNRVELEKIAVSKEDYPQENLAEFALVGRSNVGKSSFVNSIVNRKNMAYTSSKPGKTRTINFYNVDNKFRFVDLPGYGYAKVSKKEKEKWGEIINEYLNTRENLVDVIMVLDIRHKPSKDDIIMYDWIEHFGLGEFIIATKADKLSKSQINKNVNIIKETLNIKDEDRIIPYSSETKLNKNIVINKLETMLK